MPSVSVPPFSRLPLNDTLYRLVGAAKILPKINHMDTPHIQLWFAEIDNQDPDRLVYARRASGAYSFLSVIEAAGSLPTFPLGSFWHDQTIQHGLIMGDQIKIENIFIPPQMWIKVRPIDFLRSKADCGRDEFPLSGEDIAGQIHNLQEAPFYRCHSDTGQELIIPAYEIFRRFYGVCSTLSNALLSDHWHKELEKLIVESETGLTPEGDAYKILTKDDISPIGCRAIAHFQNSAYAKTMTRDIFLNIENSRRSGILHPWIAAYPHWTEDKEKGMTLSFIGQQLSNSAILVLWIYNSEFPSPPVPIIRIHATQKIPKNPLPASAELSGLDGQTRDLNEDPMMLSPPADTKQGKFISHLAISETWLNLPHMASEYKRVIFLGNPKKSNEKSIKRIKNYGTGHKSSTGKLTSASLSANAQSRIKDRFSALAVCFRKLMEEKTITGRLDYGLVNPIFIEGTVYCMLPTHLGNTLVPWAMVVRGDETRGRLCWVSELKLPDGSKQYFFELEVLDGEAFYSLIAKPIDINARLSEETLLKILKLAVSTKGRWNSGDWANLEKEIIRGRVKHKAINGVLSVDYVRRRLL